MDDSTLLAGYIGAASVMAVFLLERIGSAWSAWRAREREGVEIVYGTIAEILNVMHRDHDLWPAETQAKLLLAAAQVRLRIRRSDKHLTATFHVVTELALRVRDETRGTEEERIDLLSGLYATFADALIDWHLFKMTARGFEKRITEYVTRPWPASDAQAGATS